MFSKFWSCFSETQDPDESNTIKLNHVFANRSKEDEIFPLTVKEIEVAQKADPILTYFFKSNAVLSKGLELQLVENESCICHEGRLVISKPLQTAYDDMVSPLSSAPRAYPSQRDNESCDILEMNAYHHPNPKQSHARLAK